MLRGVLWNSGMRSSMETVTTGENYNKQQFNTIYTSIRNQCT